MWEKQGLLVPAPPPVGWGASHAALPVARPIEDEVELFFASRDAAGRSQIGRAHLPDLPGSATYEADPLLLPGAPGAFDDAGVTTGCVVDHAGEILLYYSGWTRGVTVPFYFYVGCARSTDRGKTFLRVSNAPLLERCAVDPYLTASPWVLVEDGVWRMWYVSGTGWDQRANGPTPRYHIKYAESKDGLRWNRSGHVCIDYRSEDEHAIARPCVVRDYGVYRMWYCTRGDAYRLGYAESPDGFTWERRDENAGLDPSAAGWDSEMICYPALLDWKGKRHLLYNGNGYGATGIGYAVELSS